MIRRPPRPPLFPYTTLFRSKELLVRARGHDRVTRSELGWECSADLGQDTPGADRVGEHRVRSAARRSEEHTSELQSPCNLVCRLLLEKKKTLYCCRYSTKQH